MGFFGTGASFFADFSLIFQAVILGAFIVGWRRVLEKRIAEHQKIMTTAFVLNVVFVGSYMIKSLLSEGSTGFIGPDSVKDFIYLPTVIVHGIASLLAFTLAGLTVYYGYTRSVVKKRRIFPKPLQRTTHRIIGILTIGTWTLSFLTGISVYILLYVLYQ